MQVVTDEESKPIKEEMRRHVLSLISPRIISGQKVLTEKAKKFCLVHGGFWMVTVGDFLSIIRHTLTG